MEKTKAIKLKEKASEIAQIYSRPRPHNPCGSQYLVDSIKPLSESTALLTFKRDGLKKSIVFAYWIKTGYWQYFFPTESHIFGMSKLVRELQEVEEFNFPLNEI
jgi:hypothetical protein